jgi:hypothetical protein
MGMGTGTKTAAEAVGRLGVQFAVTATIAEGDATVEVATEESIWEPLLAWHASQETEKQAVVELVAAAAI